MQDHLCQEFNCQHKCQIAHNCRNLLCFYMVFNFSMPCIFLSDSSFADICHPSSSCSRSQLSFLLLLSLSPSVFH